MKLANKVVVVTGGAGGIGGAFCKLAAATGAKVVVADLDSAAAQKLAEEIKGIGVQCDVSVEADILSLIEQAESAYGPIDLFMSNAGFGVVATHFVYEKMVALW